ncbi:hypothetical protein STEG23_028631 [Scotinomys teguina]
MQTAMSEKPTWGTWYIGFVETGAHYLALLPMNITTTTNNTLMSIIMAWIFCSISTSLPHWRVCYLNESTFSEPTTAFVGIWRVCIYHQNIKPSNASGCHEYTYKDSFVPLDIHIIQHLLLGSNILGLIGTVVTIFALRNVYTRKVQKNVTYNPFITSAILNTIVSIFALVAVIFNYYSVTHETGIAFPPSFAMPSQPTNQRIGIANVVVGLASFMFVGSGISSFTSPAEKQEYLS